MQKSLWPQSKKLAPLFSLLFLTLLFTACNSAGSIGSQPTLMSTPTPVPQPLQKLLADSEDAMKKLSTEHIVVTLSEKSQGGNTGRTSGSSMNMTYEGDMKKPHQLAVKDTIDMHNTTMNIKQNIVAEIFDGHNLYVQNKLGKWFVIANGATSTKSAEAAVASEKFSQLAMQGKLTDKGHEMMDGVQVRHITSVINNTSPNSLASLFGLASNPSRGIDTKNVTLDFWVDENTNYIHKMTTSFVMAIRSSGTTITWNANIQANMSNFNRPVTITIPAHAIPATSLSEVE